eukprot:CAMPEP_0206800970 /NCGR_PEP_ID=MMETSP0975-20121206/1964_1 /ASSEMBLY_ACC=CAM_ASM_000399 /TAXON_ID=483370 /ORGANISM="non described non described, Strain CCMP2097" /LENGTH=30 /DNA_ID= /DNA_START= /DNA_END= /DNA_ORIENTATION=
MPCLEEAFPSSCKVWHVGRRSRGAESAAAK